MNVNWVTAGLPGYKPDPYSLLPTEFGISSLHVGEHFYHEYTFPRGWIQSENLEVTVICKGFWRVTKNEFTINKTNADFSSMDFTAVLIAGEYKEVWSIRK